MQQQQYLCQPVHVRSHLYKVKTDGMSESRFPTPNMPHQMELFVTGILKRAKPQQAICHGSWCYHEVPRGGRNELLFFLVLFPFTSGLYSLPIFHTIKGQLNTWYSLGINASFLSQVDHLKTRIGNMFLTEYFSLLVFQNISFFSI